MNKVIIRPIITEKSLNDVQSSKYTFEVHVSADKKSIKEVVEKKFNVHVKDIATLIIKGKKKRAGTRRMEISLSAIKKAIVKVANGEKIDLFEKIGG